MTQAAARSRRRWRTAKVVITTFMDTLSRIHVLLQRSKMLNPLLTPANCSHGHRHYLQKLAPATSHTYTVEDTVVRKRWPGCWIGVWCVPHGKECLAFGQSDPGQCAVGISATRSTGDCDPTDMVCSLC